MTLPTNRLALARDKMEAYISKGLASAGNVIAYVEQNQPVDTLVRQAAIRFASTEEAGRIVLHAGDRAPQAMTALAVAQTAARVNWPGAFANDLLARGTVGSDVLAYGLNHLWTKRLQDEPEEADRRVLLRAVSGRYHAMLSDKYRRMDSRPLVDSFARACSSVGAVPTEGVVTETRISIRAILPEIIQTETDAVVIGVGMNNSDFGVGAWKIYAYIVRLLCINGMIGEKLLGKAHLGARLEDDVNYSDRTYRLDSAAFSSATGDTVKALLGPDGRERARLAVEKAETEKIDLEDALDRLKRTMTKAEIGDVRTALQSVDVEEMPMGDATRYRLANAISWVAQKAEDPDRRLDLQTVAGDTLLKAA